MTKGFKSVALSLGALAFVAGTTVPAMAQNKCAASKINATSKKQKCLLSLGAKECKSGSAADPGASQKCRDKFASTFAKLDAKGGCLTSDDAAAIEARVDAFVADVDSDLCVVPAGDAGKCAASKIKASAKNASCLLGLEAKQASKGGVVDPTKAQECRDHDASTFTKADAKGGCATTDDAALQEGKVDAFVDDVYGELSGTPTTTTTMSASTTTTTTLGCGTFLTKWGVYGTADGQFNDPFGVAVDGSGNVYVADQLNYRIQKFTGSGTFVTKWGARGTADGQFAAPHRVAVNGSGNVYVTDYRIQKFTDSGTFLTKWGALGSGDGQFKSPIGVAVDGSGNVYVADASNYRIQKFTGSGTFVTKWGARGTAAGQFLVPYGVAVDGSGNVYVADSGNHRIQKFTDSGTFLTKWGAFGSGDGQFKSPTDVAVDGGGNVYVADVNNARIQKFTGSGTFVTKWGVYGTADGQFRLPESVAVDGSGNVYVADNLNRRIQKFSCP